MHQNLYNHIKIVCIEDLRASKKVFSYVGTESQLLGYKSVLWGVNEPPREKTGLRGFRPGLTQTDLYKHRKELEA